MRIADQAEGVESDVPPRIAKKEPPRPLLTGAAVVGSHRVGGFGPRARAPKRVAQVHLAVKGVGYFFFAARFSSIAAWAAARRATGTRKGEHET